MLTLHLGREYKHCLEVYANTTLQIYNKQQLLCTYRHPLFLSHMGGIWEEMSSCDLSYLSYGTCSQQLLLDHEI